MNKIIPSLVGSLSLLVLSGGAGAAPKPHHDVQAGDDAVARAPVGEVARTTDHEITLQGRTIHYQATAGTLTLRNHVGEPIASMFYIAYTVPRAKGAPERPVTFLFNGGPGSASLWLNIGAFGPMIAVTAKPGITPAPPYAFVANRDCLLNKTDLVFLDAIGTGYSRIIGKGRDSQFWSVDGDVNSFAQAIVRYIELNHRWNSPKFLYGESYGTTRAAALAYALHIQEIEVSGVILQSSILNFARSLPGLDEQYIDLLPSYAAAAWYHHRAKNAPADEMTYIKEVEVFARGPYAEALAEGDEISPAHEAAIAKQMSDYIGVPVEYVERSHLRIRMESFRRELLGDQDLVIGRFDSRYEWPALGATGHYNPATDDPATAAVNGPYVAAFGEVLASLGYSTNLHYRVLYNEVIEPRWNMQHVAPGLDEPLPLPDTALDLAATMRANPDLHLLSLNGLYDMSTPFFGTEFDLSHMLLPRSVIQNITIKYYQSGHQLYSNPKVLDQMTADLDRFYGEAVGY
ncbi:MAG: S10 family peptidase [Steroidobacteraceae bacterium]